MLTSIQVPAELAKIGMNCNTEKYIQNLEIAVRQAESRGDKQRIADHARELENHMLLCGATPSLMKLAETIREVANRMDMNDCPCVKRALAISNLPERKKPKASLRTMQGFGAMLDSAFGTSTEEEPPRSPVGFISGFQQQLEASLFGGTQNTVQSAILSQKEKTVTRNFGSGFRGMLEEAFPEGEERMLPKDNFYIFSKPSKNGIFSWMRKKEDVSPHDLLASLKNRLHAAREEGKSILIVYYEELIQRLEHRLGIARQHSAPTVQRSLGFVGMLEAAFGTQREEAKVFRIGDKLRSMINFHEVELTMTQKGIVSNYKE